MIGSFFNTFLAIDREPAHQIPSYWSSSICLPYFLIAENMPIEWSCACHAKNYILTFLRKVKKGDIREGGTRLGRDIIFFVRSVQSENLVFNRNGMFKKLAPTSQIAKIHDYAIENLHVIYRSPWTRERKEVFGLNTHC